MRSLIFIALIALCLFSIMGCDTVRIQYGEAVYERSTLFSDKAIADVQIERTEDDFKASLGQADTEARIEVLEALRGVLEAAR